MYILSKLPELSNDKFHHETNTFLQFKFCKSALLQYITTAWLRQTWKSNQDCVNLNESIHWNGSNTQSKGKGGWWLSCKQCLRFFCHCSQMKTRGMGDKKKNTQNKTQREMEHEAWGSASVMRVQFCNMWGQKVNRKFQRQRSFWAQQTTFPLIPKHRSLLGSSGILW